MHSPSLPPILQELAETRWKDYLARAKQAGVSIELTANEREQLLAVWACSEFVAQSCIRQPDLLAELVDSGDLNRRYVGETYSGRLSRTLEAVHDEPALMAALRRIRRWEMVRIAWRDLAGLEDL